jgi:hypothetical protein
MMAVYVDGLFTLVWWFHIDDLILDEGTELAVYYLNLTHDFSVLADINKMAKVY